MSMGQMLTTIFLAMVCALWVFFVAYGIANLLMDMWFTKKTKFVTDIVAAYVNLLQKASEKKAANGREKPPDEGK